MFKNNLSIGREFSSTQKTDVTTQGPADLPWTKNSSANNDAFFPSQKIDAERWNKLYPYRLLVRDIVTGQTVGGGSSFDSSTNIKTTLGGLKGQGDTFEFALKQDILNGAWEFNLPITPQMISIQDNYAINTTATMRGVVEEHNGVKFKTINIQGTTGIWVQKPSIEGKLETKSALSSIFGGTIEAFEGLVNQAQQVASAFTGKHPVNPTKKDNPSEKKYSKFETGYYQAQLLSQFLERYAMEKKNPANKNWRLVLDIPKDNQAFIVTPVSFNLQKSAQKPMEHNFSLQLKAWKRISIDSSNLAGNQTLPGLDLDVLQRVNSTIRSTRNTLAGAVNLVKAVRSDVLAPFTALRQTALAIKDLSGLVKTVADFPRQIGRDIESSIEGTVQTLNGRFGRSPTLRGRTSSQAKTSYAIATISGRLAINEGLTSDQVANGAIGNSSAQDNQLDPITDIYANPEEYFDFFDSIEIDRLDLTPEQFQAIEDEIEVARLLTVDDFRGFQQTLMDLANEISNQYGANDPFYSSIYNKPEPKTRSTPMTIEENEILVSLYEAIQALDLLISTKKYDDLKTQSPLQFVGGYAEQSGIQVDSFISKYLVPVPFGFTIEQIAARYMGNPDKWIEIVTINGLRSPYIDEVGFTLNLMSNADARRFTVQAEEGKLYIGQKIELSSNIVQRFVRKITDLQGIGNSTYVVTVDGEADLESLKISDNAKLKAYLPGTVNSQNQIYIPSNQPSQEDDRIQKITHLSEDRLNKISKVDLLLSDNGDLAINSVGDIRLANGLTNLVQALKLKVITRKGTLIRHPDFGLGLSAGMSVADIESGAIANELNKIVLDDPRFSGIQNLEIRIEKSTVYVTMAVKVANGSGIVPITFNTNS